mgnify:CR=1 FL=1
MGGAVTAETLAVNPCKECGYDMGRNYIECTITGECPECGHNFVLEVYEDPDLDDEYVNNRAPERIFIEQRVTGDQIYCSFELPSDYRWEDVSDWRVRGEVVHITFDDGNEWSTELFCENQYVETTGDFAAYDEDRNHIGDY